MRDLSGDSSTEIYKTTLISKNITVSRRRTSVRLEPEMWLALRDIARREKCSIHDICSLVSVRKNARTSLTAAIRVFLMLYFRAASTEEGHRKSGHGNFEFMKRRARLGEAVSQAGDKKTVQ
jgi:predicted DNA-binding ribbon-helix-helix protein